MVSHQYYGMGLIRLLRLIRALLLDDAPGISSWCAGAVLVRDIDSCLNILKADGDVGSSVL